MTTGILVGDRAVRSLKLVAWGLMMRNAARGPRVSSHHQSSQTIFFKERPLSREARRRVNN